MPISDPQDGFFYPTLTMDSYIQSIQWCNFIILIDHHVTVDRKVDRDQLTSSEAMISWPHQKPGDLDHHCLQEGIDFF